MPNEIHEVTFCPRGKKVIFFKITFLGSLNFLFCYYSPLEEDVTLIIYESPLYRILCQFWLKLAIWFLSKKNLKAVNVFSLCGYYLPLKKCMPLNLNKFEFPLPKDTLCHVWLKLAQRFWRSCQYIPICCHYLPLERARTFI